jgi:hypothetical protein
MKDLKYVYIKGFLSSNHPVFRSKRVDLCLSASNCSIKANAASQTAGSSTESSLDLTNSWNLLVSHVLESTSGATSLLDRSGWATISGCVEGNEEEEVRGENADTGNCGEFFSSTGSVVWPGWEIGTGEISVRCIVDKSYLRD